MRRAADAGEGAAEEELAEILREAAHRGHPAGEHQPDAEDGLARIYVDEPRERNADDEVEHDARRPDQQAQPDLAQSEVALDVLDHQPEHGDVEEFIIVASVSKVRAYQASLRLGQGWSDAGAAGVASSSAAASNSKFDPPAIPAPLSPAPGDWTRPCRGMIVLSGHAGLQANSCAESGK
ncbi:MAG: hypothetical protein WDN24_17535 [Sphingomonas sp.]